MELGIMANVVFSPEWFYTIDIGLSLIGILICVLLGLYSLKIYKYFKQRKYLYFSGAFFLIALGSVIRDVMNSAVYYRLFTHTANPVLANVYQFLLHSEVYTLIGFFLGHFFTLLGFMTIFFLAHELISRKLYILLAYLISVSAWFSNQAYFSYHVTSVVILFGIFVKYFQNYKVTKNLSVVIAFGLFTISEFAFLFLAQSQLAYVIGAIIQVFAFVFLLINFLMVKMK